MFKAVIFITVISSQCDNHKPNHTAMWTLGSLCVVYLTLFNELELGVKEIAVKFTSSNQF